MKGTKWPKILLRPFWHSTVNMYHLYLPSSSVSNLHLIVRLVCGLGHQVLGLGSQVSVNIAAYWNCLVKNWCTLCIHFSCSSSVRFRICVTVFCKQACWYITKTRGQGTCQKSGRYCHCCGFWSPDLETRGPVPKPGLGGTDGMDWSFWSVRKGCIFTNARWIQRTLSKIHR